jgi:hypothetical protein
MIASTGTASRKRRPRPFLAQCCTWHRQVTSSEMHSVHVSAVWFLVSGTDFGKDQWAEGLVLVFNKWLGRGSRIRSRLRIFSEPSNASKVQVQAGGRPGRMPVSSAAGWFLAPAHQDYPSIRNNYSPSASGLTMHQHAHLDKLPDSFLMGSRFPCFMASVHKVCLLLSRCFCVIRHTGFAMHSLPCHFHCYVFSAAPNLCSTPPSDTHRIQTSTPSMDIHLINNGHTPYQWIQAPKFYTIRRGQRSVVVGLVLELRPIH